MIIKKPILNTEEQQRILNKTDEKFAEQLEDKDACKKPQIKKEAGANKKPKRNT